MKSVRETVLTLVLTGAAFSFYVLDKGLARYVHWRWRLADRNRARRRS